MEHEIQGHAKKVYKVWNNPKKSIWEKIKDIAIEVGIIVFAITVSIWFHNMSEKRHLQNEVKEFLRDLKVDLQANKEQFARQAKNYAFYRDAFYYFSTRRSLADINADSNNKYIMAIQQTEPFITRTGQYEGFKSSGKLINIENKKIAADLIGLYQEDIPQVINVINEANNFKYKLQDNAIQSLKMVNGEFTNFNEVLLKPNVQIYAQILGASGGISEKLNELVIKTNNIIEAIDKYIR
jgi:hypothetical protein